MAVKNDCLVYLQKNKDKIKYVPDKKYDAYLEISPDGKFVKDISVKGGSKIWDVNTAFAGGVYLKDDLQQLKPSDIEGKKYIKCERRGGTTPQGTYDYPTLYIPYNKVTQVSIKEFCRVAGGDTLSKKFDSINKYCKNGVAIVFERDNERVKDIMSEMEYCYVKDLRYGPKVENPDLFNDIVAAYQAKIPLDAKRQKVEKKAEQVVSTQSQVKENKPVVEEKEPVKRKSLLDNLVKKPEPKKESNIIELQTEIPVVVSLSAKGAIVRSTLHGEAYYNEAIEAFERDLDNVSIKGLDNIIKALEETKKIHSAENIGEIGAYTTLIGTIRLTNNTMTKRLEVEKSRKELRFPKYYYTDVLGLNYNKLLNDPVYKSMVSKGIINDYSDDIADMDRGLWNHLKDNIDYTILGEDHVYLDICKDGVKPLEKAKFIHAINDLYIYGYNDNGTWRFLCNIGDHDSKSLSIEEMDKLLSTVDRRLFSWGCFYDRFEVSDPTLSMGDYIKYYAEGNKILIRAACIIGSIGPDLHSTSTSADTLKKMYTDGAKIEDNKPDVSVEEQKKAKEALAPKTREQKAQEKEQLNKIKENLKEQEKDTKDNRPHFNIVGRYTAGTTTLDYHLKCDNMPDRSGQYSKDVTYYYIGKGLVDNCAGIGIAGYEEIDGVKAVKSTFLKGRNGTDLSNIRVIDIDAGLKKAGDIHIKKGSDTDTIMEIETIVGVVKAGRVVRGYWLVDAANQKRFMDRFKVLDMAGKGLIGNARVQMYNGKVLLRSVNGYTPLDKLQVMDENGKTVEAGSSSDDGDGV